MEVDGGLILNSLDPPASQDDLTNAKAGIEEGLDLDSVGDGLDLKRAIDLLWGRRAIEK